MEAYPVVIYKDEGSDYGTVVPDLPGCVSAGKNLASALSETYEAIQCHLEGMAMDGEVFPAASDQTEVQQAYPDATYAAVGIDLDRLSVDSERVNITLPKWLLSVIDGVETNRSRFLAKSAIEALQRKAG